VREITGKEISDRVKIEGFDGITAEGKPFFRIPSSDEELAPYSESQSVTIRVSNPDYLRYFPFISSLFIFILFSNLLGLIPGSYTVTSQIVVTGVFAIAVYGLSLVIGFQLHGVKFLGILVPPGTPGWLLPLMIPIELISQLARPISLAVRLFANMTAGHVILGVLFGLTIGGGLLIGWLPFSFTIVLYGLEVGIAFIQAYIFVVLTCVYIGDAIHLH